MVVYVMFTNATRLPFVLFDTVFQCLTSIAYIWRIVCILLTRKTIHNINTGYACRTHSGTELGGYFVGLMNGMTETSESWLVGLMWAVTIWLSLFFSDFKLDRLKSCTKNLTRSWSCWETGFWWFWLRFDETILSFFFYYDKR